MSSRRLQYVSIGTRSDHSRTCKDTNQIKVTFTKVSFDLEFLRRAALTRVARAGRRDAGHGASMGCGTKAVALVVRPSKGADERGAGADDAGAARGEIGCAGKASSCVVRPSKGAEESGACAGAAGTARGAMGCAGKETSCVVRPSKGTVDGEKVDGA